jgi:hypothetical protein
MKFKDYYNNQLDESLTDPLFYGALVGMAASILGLVNPELKPAVVKKAKESYRSVKGAVLWQKIKKDLQTDKKLNDLFDDMNAGNRNATTVLMKYIRDKYESEWKVVRAALS